MLKWPCSSTAAGAVALHLLHCTAAYLLDTWPDAAPAAPSLPIILHYYTFQLFHGSTAALLGLAQPAQPVAVKPYQLLQLQLRQDTATSADSLPASISKSHPYPCLNNNPTNAPAVCGLWQSPAGSSGVGNYPRGAPRPAPQCMQAARATQIGVHQLWSTSKT
jgi:hypothetical protein